MTWTDGQNEVSGQQNTWKEKQRRERKKWGVGGVRGARKNINCYS